MTSLEIYEPPESLIVEDELEKSARKELHIREVGIFKTIRDALLRQHREHVEKFQDLGPRVFQEFFDLLLEDFGSELLTPIVDNYGETHLDFIRLEPRFFHLFSLNHTGFTRGSYLFDIDVLRTESGWTEIMKAWHAENSRKRPEYRFDFLDRFDPERIQSQLACGVLEAIVYEKGVLIERLEGYEIKKSMGKTRSVLLVSDSEADDSVDMLTGVESFHPFHAVNFFKDVFRYSKRSFPHINTNLGINVKQRIKLGEKTDLVSLIRPLLAKRQHERHDIYTVDLSH